MARSEQPIGVILAGGEGRRMGGTKATVALLGEPLLKYPLAAMRAALGEVAVITKAHILLPALDGALVWVEPDEPSHPLFGIAEALELATGRPVLSCPGDMPFITASLLGALARERADPERAVIAVCRGRLWPLLGRFPPCVADAFHEAACEGVPVTDAVELLDPVLVEVSDELQLFDVDTPYDLLQATAMLGRSQSAGPPQRS